MLYVPSNCNKLRDTGITLVNEHDAAYDLNMRPGTTGLGIIRLQRRAITNFC